MNFFSRVFWMVAAFLVFSGAARATSPEDTSKGSFLYHACQAALIGHHNDEQVRLGNICFSYIEGFIDGEGPVIKYKFFVGVSYPEIASTYVHYVEKQRVPQHEQALGVGSCFENKILVRFKAVATANRLAIHWEGERA